MSDLLSIGSSGLAAYRNALNTIGENVANAETPGYARRKVVLREVAPGGASDVIYKDSYLFNGVQTVGIERAWDQFKATEARFAASAAGRGAVREQWLGAVENALDDGTAGIGSTMTRFFNAGASLSADPSDRLGRGAMLTALADVATAFRATGEALGRVATGITDSAKLDVTGLNNALAALNDLNGTIRTSTPGSSARAALEDERDKMIDYVAERIDISVSFNTDGTANITSGSASSAVLLNGQGPALLTLVPAADGRLSLQSFFNGTTTPMPVGGGKLAGLIDSSNVTADRRAQLDALATDFVATINTWSAGGLDANGNPGADLVEAPGGATTMRALVTDPDLVAAGTAGAPNGNLLALETVRTNSAVENRWSDIVSENAQTLASAKSEAAASASWRDFSRAALDGVTGIDLDREAAELLRFQQAYTAATRIIQVGRETIDALFQAL